MMFMVSCSSDTLQRGSLPLSRLTDTGCKSEVLSRAMENHEETPGAESISLKAISHQKGSVTLQVKHLNAMFNCSSDKIWVKSDMEGKIIKIYEVENSVAANCMCAHDLSFELGPLAEGSYQVYLYHSVKEPQEGDFSTHFTVNVSPSLNQTISVE